ncbi:hypothetical protein F5879DRAFT_1003395 [Lentinula edodes]|nr:hypothetical protein F5879DRAFT_1003395 [Lentinula edodes]
MDDVSVILLSLDADTAITEVSCIAVVSADSLCYQAQKRLQAAFDTKGASFVFFMLNEPIGVDEEPAMTAQLGHFSYEWIRWTKGTLREALKTNFHLTMTAGEILPLDITYASLEWRPTI